MGADGFLLYNEKRVDLKSVKAHTQNTSNLQLKLNNLSALFFFFLLQKCMKRILSLLFF